MARNENVLIWEAYNASKTPYVLLIKSDDGETYFFGSVWSSEKKARFKGHSEEHDFDEWDVEPVNIATNTPILVQFYDPEEGHWIYHGLYNTKNEAIKDVSGLGIDPSSEDVHYSTVTVNDGNPDTGTKNYGLKRRWTDSE